MDDPSGDALGPLPNRQHVDRCSRGSLGGTTKDSPGCPRWGRPSPCGGLRDLAQGPFPGMEAAQHPPAGLILQSLVARLADARQGDAISGLLLLSPAQSSIHVSRPLLTGPKERNREVHVFEEASV